MTTRPPVAALIIFDGWGVREAREANAIANAKTPVMNRLYATQAHTEIEASGEAVGLPPGVMGNSEVGHLTIGSGRVIFQDVMRITKAIETGAFARNQQLVGAIKKTVESGTTLHVWGLLSDGSVHSHIDHLFALLDLAAAEGATKIAVHAILDGRDKPPRSALPFIEQLEIKLGQLGRGRIATVIGRYFAMDRDKRWERVEKAWRAIVEADGIPAASAREAVERSYAADKSDEFVEPHVIGERSPMADGDQVICFNFRADRARELTTAIALADFAGFKRSRLPKVGYVCMTEYDRSFGLPLAFGPEDIRNTLAEVLANAGLRNLRVAETEKYAHVTYFLNGGVEKPFPFEERALIASSKVATYDLEPAMKAAEIAKRAAEEIQSGNSGVIVMNFANPDMVGHTGHYEATVAAIEATDAALGVVIAALGARSGVALITSDHGNAEFMADPATGQAHTAHTTNPVPLILFDPNFRGRLRSGGTLADVAPTLLAMLGLEAPPEMTGHDLRVLTSA
ncbi:MAG: 2,3-bisphosphoglycerate-independent phosphoglycerate mutase [Candidatus Binatus sp.]|uniref:2,3-bisphosphoglycerate-independent phosphoglycerate mutase n=1 Tax=Candidatus Binatus sp. TaxID=2811406 RepID=UPI00271FD335|nr:2,3-bisphosphoglycerate-independent phosphoglycerate mutase [Candidatus Binatus sp.]MDO8434324.1 2,3-bisphosphoglycerate-independent phosphoglycerate mutase [Candidatus Binatus sp.]